jgi:hypothetical protein
MKCSKCNEEKELVRGNQCKECKNAYERERKRGTKERKELTNIKIKEALNKKKESKKVELIIDDKLSFKCKLCNETKIMRFFNLINYNTELSDECNNCFSSKCTRCHEVKELVKGKWCKECKNEYERIRRSDANATVKEKIKEKQKERYHKNKENVKEIKFDDNETKECSVCNEVKKLDKFHVAKTKGKIRAECRTCSSKKRKEYYQTHKDETIKQTNKYKNERMKRDPAFKIERNMRCRLYHALKKDGAKKSDTTMKLVGCTPTFLKGYLEAKFTDGMTWDNYGDFHIDHIRPCASFNLLNEEEQRICFHYKNLQPLWGHDNLIKGSKF